MCSAHALGSSVWGPPVAALCMTSFVATAHGQPLSIVADGRPNAVIVAPTDADDQTRSAAETLASYIKQASGAVLEVLDESRQMDFKGVLIHVGPTTAAKRLAKLLDGLDEDGFVIDSTGGAEVLICGPSAWGTEFGVYEFLERYVGVRWLLPGPDGDDVPSASSIEVPREVVRQEPAFFSRLFSGLKGPAQARWARFNRMHGRIAFHHNLIRLFPPETYTKTHPEWFPMKDGKTRFLPPTNDTHGWQPCFSAPGLVEEAIKNICRYFEEHPEATSYSLGVNDSSGYCRCPECMARITGEDNFLGRTDFSDLYYDWANKVVEGVLEKHPDKWFGCLAYSEVAAPPKRVKVHPRIIPYMTYDRMKWIDPEVRAAGEQATRAWHETSPTLGWYDYIYGTPYCLPRVYFHHMADYYRFGRANGVRALYAEAYPNWGEGPKLYVSLKLQWAPDLDVDAILKEWYERCVGPKAAPSLARYYAIWERFWTERILDSKWFTVGGQYLRFNAPGYLADVDERDVAESRRLLESCVAEAETPKQRARAELLLRAFEYYEASALAYRADQVAATAALNTEADALAALDEAQRGLRMAERRRRLALNEFPNDPVLVHPLPIERYPPLAGQTWGSRAVWSLVDWLTKSDAVRRRVSELAEGSDSAAVREATGLMLAIAKGDLVPVSKNASFEEGEGKAAADWSYWVKWGIGSMQRVTGTSHTGDASLQCLGMKRGGPVQNIQPVQPGRYAAMAYVYVPEGQESKGTASLLVTPVDPDGKNITSFESAVVPRPGEWTLLAVAADIPAQIRGRDVARLMLIPLVNGFTEGDEVYWDDVALYRVPAGR